MKQVNVREAREQISRLLERVQVGEEVLILRRGKPAARLVGPLLDNTAFRSRVSLREDLPPIKEAAGEVVRHLREAERF